METRKKTKQTALIGLNLLLLSLIIFSICLIRLGRPVIPVEEKRHHMLAVDWVSYHLDTATEAAPMIVLGTIGPFGKTIFYEDFDDPGDGDCYRPAKIRVIQMIKGNPYAKAVPYLEWGGETDSVVVTVMYTKPTLEGRTYLMFLSRRGTSLTPFGRLLVDENGMVSPIDNMRMDSSGAYPFDPEAPIPVEDYIAAVRQYLD